MSSDCAQKLRANGLVKAFKLQSSLDIGNMHAFGPNGNMKKYGNEVEILEEFYHKRRALYEERKKYQIGAYQQSIGKLQQKIKFIEMIIGGAIQFKGKPKDQLVSELQTHQFQDIDYLLSMAMWNLTHDKIIILKSELLCQQNQLHLLQNTTIDALWKDDLDEIASRLTPRKEEERPHKKRRKK